MLIDAEPAPAPTIIGGYTVNTEIGGGVSSRVFAATDERGRDVAIKLVPGASVSRSAARRLSREVEALRRTAHPGFIDVGRTGPDPIAIPYIVTRLVHGDTLSEHCRKNSIDAVGVIALVIRVCHALEQVHARGVLHLDIKPQNIIVKADGTPVIIDFGHARLADESHTPADARAGTLRYMSPELVSARAAPSVACDVYSLAVVCFELLADGQWVYETRDSRLDERQLIESVLPCRLGAARPDLAGPLDDVLACALAKDPGRRYATALAFAEDLQRALDAHPVHARKSTAIDTLRLSVSQARHVLVVLAILACLLAGGAIGWFTAYRQATHVKEAELSATRLLAYGDMDTAEKRAEIAGAFETWRSPVAVVAYDRIGMTAREHDELDEALQWLGMERQRAREVHGEHHQFTLRAEQVFAETLVMAGRSDQAESELRAILDELAPEPADAAKYDLVTSTRLLRLHWTLGEAIAAEGRTDEARALLTRVYDMQDVLQSDEHTDKGETLRSLQRLAYIR